MSDKKFLKAELDKITDDIFAYGLPKSKDDKQIKKKANPKKSNRANKDAALHDTSS